MILVMKSYDKIEVKAADKEIYLHVFSDSRNHSCSTGFL